MRELPQVVLGVAAELELQAMVPEQGGQVDDLVPFLGDLDDRAVLGRGHATIEASAAHGGRAGRPLLRCARPPRHDQPPQGYPVVIICWRRLRNH
jgi:hypothetical protein